MDIFLRAVSFSVIIVLLSNDLKPFDHILFFVWVRVILRKAVVSVFCLVYPQS